MKNRISVSLFALLVALLAATAHAKTFYVAPNGPADADGSAAKPFPTLITARDAARAFVGKEAVEIVVKDGQYFLNDSFRLEAADGGTREFPVVYRAENAKGARLLGGVALDGSRFTPVTDAETLARLPETACGKALEFNLEPVLTAAGIQKLSVLGEHVFTPLAIPELYVNGVRQRTARWPNEGWATVAKIVDSGSKADSGSAFDAAKMQGQKEPPRGGTFEYSGDVPNRWNVEKGVWLWGYWCFDWHDDVLKVAAIDPEKKQISFNAQSTYGLRQGNPSPRRWRAIHLLEELDVPGEYYVDSEAKKLYFIPDCDLTKAQITFSAKGFTPVMINGAKYVTFDGFVLEETFGAGISLSGSSFITIQNCTVRNTHHAGIYAVGGECNHYLRNLIEFNGSGGLQIADSGDRKTLTRGNCLVENNVIHDFAEHRLCYANGLALGGVGHIARHNELYNAPHQAVSVGGNDMLFELNVVHHVCLTGDDAAAFYKGRNPSCRGNVIRWNYWHDIGSPRGHGNAAIYFDDGDGGEKVFGNIFVNCGDPGKGSFGTIFCHGGHGNFAENNIFVDCKRPLGSAPWNDQRWKEYIDAPLWQTRLLKDVNITSDVYLRAYPELKNFMDGAPIAERHNFATRNVFVNPTMDPTGTWDLDETDVTLDHDPGFVDFKGGNLNLRDDSEIFRKIPGFQKIPFTEMGPQ